MKKNRLRQVRSLSCFSQAEISKATGIHYSTLSRIENGVIPGTETQKNAIATLFKIDKEMIFPDGK